MASSPKAPHLTLDEVLTRVTSTADARRDAHLTAYRATVRDVAAGKKIPPPDEIERLLTNAGKSVDDLRSDVDAQTRRHVDAALVAAAENVDGQETEIDEAIGVSTANLQTAIELHAKTCEPLSLRKQELKRQREAAVAARRRLIESCTDPARLAALDTVRAENHAATVRLNELRQQLAGTQRSAQLLNGIADGTIADVGRAEAEAAVAHAPAIEIEIATLSKRVADSYNLEARAVALLLDP